MVTIKNWWKKWRRIPYAMCTVTPPHLKSTQKAMSMDCGLVRDMNILFNWLKIQIPTLRHKISFFIGTFYATGLSSFKSNTRGETLFGYREATEVSSSHCNHRTSSCGTGSCLLLTVSFRTRDLLWQLIWKNQNPPDCKTAEYMIGTAFPSGKYSQTIVEKYILWTESSSAFLTSWVIFKLHDYCKNSMNSLSFVKLLFSQVLGPRSTWRRPGCPSLWGWIESS
jgi:hypothetical protein